MRDACHVHACWKDTSTSLNPSLQANLFVLPILDGMLGCRIRFCHLQEVISMEKDQHD